MRLVREAPSKEEEAVLCFCGFEEEFDKVLRELLRWDLWKMGVDEWWRCAQYFCIAYSGWIPRDNRCLYIYVCIFMFVVVNVWGLWECLLCSGRC